MASSKTGYNNVMSTYTEATRLFARCALVAFYNYGNTIMVLNNALPLPPGGSISFDGEKDEMDTSVYTVSFDQSNVVSPAVPQNGCLYIQKFYNID